MFRLVCFLGLLFFKAMALAQTCSIQSPDFICRDDLISFDVTASSGIVSVKWELGDASTSTQKSFNHTYSNAGPKNVRVILSLSGGASCTAVKKVTVYDLPVFKITPKSDNIYCLWKNLVCLIDSSYATDSATGIKKRLVLWDDGAQTVTNNPAKGSSVCHNYTASGDFKVTVELTTDKDCKARKEIDIKILKDAVPKINVYSPDNRYLRYCDSAVTVFEDQTTGDTSQVTGKLYDWGDGKTTFTRKKKVTHFYKQSGTYSVSLTYYQSNGCATTKDTLIEVTVYSVPFDITKNAEKQCIGRVFRFRQNDKLQGAWYYWFLNDTIMGYDLEMKSIDLTPYLGKKLISLLVENNGCIQRYAYDTIEVIGISPRIVVLNENQCANIDTVYFRLKDVRYGMGKISYLYNFGDDKAPQCTSSLKKGLDLNSNCNFAADSFGRHFYINGVCRQWRLTIIDEEFGCDTIFRNGSLNLVKPPRSEYKFKFQVNRRCLGDKEDYYFHFTNGLCDILNVRVNLDSACGKKLFSIRNVISYPYTKTCDPSGNVTVGYAIQFGNPVIYSSYSDTSHFIVDPGRVCYDTVWNHHWFKVLSDPDAKISLTKTCLPATIKPLIKDSIQQNLTFNRWNWGDGSKMDTFRINKPDSVLMRGSHLYTKPGRYYITHYVENEGRCFSKDSTYVDIGFHMKISLDSVICPGSSVQLFDTISYGDTTGYYWFRKNRRAAGLETFKWNFGDGRGFVTDTSNPVVRFPKTGNYLIQLAAKDSVNCHDTLHKIINVGGVHAGIRKITKKLICDDIIQFLDSSYSDYKPPLDSIVKYYWDFGDNGNISTLKNPYQFYKTFGEYTIFQRVENSRGCRDSTTIKIKIEGPVSRFQIEGDSVGCAPFTAEFKNGSEKARDYIWSFGDPANTRLYTNKDTNVRFTYRQPGVYYVYLLATDSVINPNAGNALYYCKSLFPDTALPQYILRKITVLPAPKARFSVDPVHCKGSDIVLTDQSDTLYTLYRWRIKGVDSITTSSKTGVLRTGDTGWAIIDYYPQYNPIPPFNKACLDTARKIVRISEIRADFELIKDSTSCPVFYFTNTTKGAQFIQWDLGDPLGAGNQNTRFENSFSHRYNNESGVFTPCLFVKDNLGCTDTLCREVNVELVTKVIIPNVFTPDNDGFNDVYDILATGTDQYQLSIYNRWGQRVFYSEKDGQGDDGNNWNGTVDQGGALYPDGTYFYLFNYTLKCGGKSFKTNGTLTLIRGKD